MSNPMQHSGDENGSSTGSNDPDQTSGSGDESITPEGFDQCSYITVSELGPESGARSPHNEPASSIATESCCPGLYPGAVKYNKFLFEAQIRPGDVEDERLTLLQTLSDDFFQEAGTSWRQELRLSCSFDSHYCILKLKDPPVEGGRLGLIGFKNYVALHGLRLFHIICFHEAAKPLHLNHYFVHHIERYDYDDNKQWRERKWSDKQWRERRWSAKHRTRFPPPSNGDGERGSEGGGDNKGSRKKYHARVAKIIAELWPELLPISQPSQPICCRGIDYTGRVRYNKFLFEAQIRPGDVEDERLTLLRTLSDNFFQEAGNSWRQELLLFGNCRGQDWALKLKDPPVECGRLGIIGFKTYVAAHGLQLWDKICFHEPAKPLHLNHYFAHRVEREFYNGENKQWRVRRWSAKHGTRFPPPSNGDGDRGSEGGGDENGSTKSYDTRLSKLVAELWPEILPKSQPSQPSSSRATESPIRKLKIFKAQVRPGDLEDEKLTLLQTLSDNFFEEAGTSSRHRLVLFCKCHKKNWPMKLKDPPVECGRLGLIGSKPFVAAHDLHPAEILCFRQLAQPYLLIHYLVHDVEMDGDDDNNGGGSKGGGDENGSTSSTRSYDTTLSELEAELWPESESESESQPSQPSSSRATEICKLKNFLFEAQVRPGDLEDGKLTLLQTLSDNFFEEAGTSSWRQLVLFCKCHSKNWLMKLKDPPVECGRLGIIGFEPYVAAHDLRPPEILCFHQLSQPLHLLHYFFHRVESNDDDDDKCGGSEGGGDGEPNSSNGDGERGGDGGPKIL